MSVIGSDIDGVDDGHHRLVLSPARRAPYRRDNGMHRGMGGLS
jgi:hypothetical protein